MSLETDALERLFSAIRFAAAMHRDQRRKGVEEVPYINHPIEVAEVLVRVGGVRDVVLLQAAILHDTIEDTEATPLDLEREFGSEVLALVEEVTDDKSLPKGERKRLQIEQAPKLSPRAQQLKLADKICNVRDLTRSPPAGWPYERQMEYLAWCERVIAGCREVNAALEREFDAVLAAGTSKLERERRD